MSDVPSGKTEAYEAIVAAADDRDPDQRLSATTLRRVIDVAWAYQFHPVDRSKARQELQDVLAVEYRRAKGEAQ
jgi:hypothetical protein